MYYTTLVADPPWQYKDALDMSDGVARSSTSQYATLPIEKVKAFLRNTPAVVIHSAGVDLGHDRPLVDTLKADGFLWLWVTNPFLLDGSGFDVCKAWGYTPKALVTWTKGRLAMVKTGENVEIGGKSGPLYREKIIERPGMGRYTRGVTEHLILATRGKVAHLVQARNVTNWFLAPRGAHSEKPDEAYRRIKLVTPGPYLALFERNYRPGFDCVGDELPEMAPQQEAA